MYIINATVNPDHILTLKRQLDNAELKNVCHAIDEEYLITLPEYHNIKRETKTRHKINYIGIGARLQSHKAKLEK